GESGAIHPQAVYTSRFISLDELEVINSWVNGVINDDNKIIESREDNIPIEYMEKLMLKIDKTAE
ncbi:17125_t:CDS:1, partial [Gigaspora margarita]